MTFTLLFSQIFFVPVCLYFSYSLNIILLKFGKCCSIAYCCPFCHLISTPSYFVAKKNLSLIEEQRCETLEMYLSHTGGQDSHMTQFRPKRCKLNPWVGLSGKILECHVWDMPPELLPSCRMQTLC